MLDLFKSFIIFLNSEWFVAITTISEFCKTSSNNDVFFTNGSCTFTIAPAAFNNSTNFTDGEFRRSSLPSLNDSPKTPIFSPKIFPLVSFILLITCCGIDSFTFHAVYTILENVVLLSRNNPSLLKHGPPAKPGFGILLLAYS